MIVHVYYCNNVKQKNFRIVEIAILSGMVKLISCPEVRALDWDLDCQKFDYYSSIKHFDETFLGAVSTLSILFFVEAWGQSKKKKEIGYNNSSSFLRVEV